MGPQVVLSDCKHCMIPEHGLCTMHVGYAMNDNVMSAEHDELKYIYMCMCVCVCVFLLVIVQRLPGCDPECPLGYECKQTPNGTYICGGQSLILFVLPVTTCVLK